MFTAHVANAKELPPDANFEVTCSSGGYTSYEEYATRVDVDGSTVIVVHLLDGGRDVLVNRECTVHRLRGKVVTPELA